MRSWYDFRDRGKRERYFCNFINESFRNLSRESLAPVWSGIELSNLHEFSRICRRQRILSRINFRKRGKEIFSKKLCSFTSYSALLSLFHSWILIIIPRNLEKFSYFFQFKETPLSVLTILTKTFVIELYEFGYRMGLNAVIAVIILF